MIPPNELLRRHGLDGATEEAFPNDGWSGATITRLRDADGRAFVLKRDSPAADWIARATNDGPLLREAWFAGEGPALPWPARNPAVGAAYDEATETSAVLMPDLTGILFDWNEPLPVGRLDPVLDALAALHGRDWGDGLEAGRAVWTPLGERVSLICRTSLERPGPAHDAVADRLLPGWDAWDRRATPAAGRIIDDLANDPGPLLKALSAEPPTLLHGDLKLANAGIAADGSVELVDWQMVMMAPVAVELGWFLVANVNALPLPPAAVLDRYWARRPDVEPSDRSRQDDLAILVGLLLRGWRKGFDADAGITLASGVSAADDLRWWCDRAAAAVRVLG
ncbi:MAG TPA: phosphotransferase [Candidatus Limnocylindrales bacterium]|nr:phosphotransferase [Candidatus Limnocylindrales bacterium]